jgi:hypothetical protein
MDLRSKLGPITEDMQDDQPFDPDFKKKMSPEALARYEASIEEGKRIVAETQAKMKGHNKDAPRRGAAVPR